MLTKVQFHFSSINFTGFEQMRKQNQCYTCHVTCCSSVCKVDAPSLRGAQQGHKTQ